MAKQRVTLKGGRKSFKEALEEENIGVVDDSDIPSKEKVDLPMLCKKKKFLIIVGCEAIQYGVRTFWNI